MKCNLKITSYYDGENTTVEGIIEVNGKTHTIHCEGSASERGTHANIDGKDHWWCESKPPNSVKEIEEAVGEVIADCATQMEEYGYTSYNWIAIYIDGKVVQAVFDTSDD